MLSLALCGRFSDLWLKYYIKYTLIVTCMCRSSLLKFENVVVLVNLSV